MKAVWRGGAQAAHAALLALVLWLAGCDGDRIRALEEGVSTEADVRRAFGEPERIWPEADGARTFEYNRQPAGQRNYMITIGPDGRMSALRQVLTPANFAAIQPGMAADEVRRRLGRPMKDTPFARIGETVWDWRYLEPPNTPMVFSATFGPDGRVLRTGSTLDPQSEAQRGG
ncbi:outer membrane protein assembly factor BamE [Xylophilus sp. ASV27]|uniref:outer membrane protein assembly factor BamE n=1 Tax=Xylophilus sp. ASV27 TaxID=2795129 RepID=UPI0018ECCA5A|nr:outer membrane protein assembly factor BamE [Xylophilus sp. ASV27]